MVEVLTSSSEFSGRRSREITSITTATPASKAKTGQCVNSTWLNRAPDTGTPYPDCPEYLPVGGTSIHMTDFTDKAALDSFNNSIVEEFRTNAGVVGGPFEGATLLLLHTTGAKSGEPRLNPLAYFGIDGKIFIVGSKAGADTNPAWVHNLRANPSAHIEVGTSGRVEAYDVTARELPADERDAVFAQVVAHAPGFGEYQAKTSRVIPLFELERV